MIKRKIKQLGFLAMGPFGPMVLTFNTIKAVVKNAQAYYEVEQGLDGFEQKMTDWEKQRQAFYETQNTDDLFEDADFQEL